MHVYTVGSQKEWDARSSDYIKTQMAAKRSAELKENLILTRRERDKDPQNKSKQEAYEEAKNAWDAWTAKEDDDTDRSDKGRGKDTKRKFNFADYFGPIVGNVFNAGSDNAQPISLAQYTDYIDQKPDDYWTAPEFRDDVERDFRAGKITELQFNEYLKKKFKNQSGGVAGKGDGDGIGFGDGSYSDWAKKLNKAFTERNSGYEEYSPIQRQYYNPEGHDAVKPATAEVKYSPKMGESSEEKKRKEELLAELLGLMG
jgi:hypothetical protein